MTLYYPGHGEPHDWIAEAWSEADDGLGSHVGPFAGDDGTFTANSTQVNLSGNVACDNLDLTAAVYGLATAVGAFNVDVGANVAWVSSAVDVTVYCGGSFELISGGPAGSPTGGVVMDGTGTLTLNGNSLPTVEVNTAGTVTLGDALTCSGFTFTAGAFDANGKTVTVVGDLLIAGHDSFVGSGEWHHGGGDLANPKDSSAFYFGKLGIGEGGVSNLADRVRCRKLHVGAGSGGVASTTNDGIYVQPDYAGVSITQEGNPGTIAGHVDLRQAAAGGEIGPLTLSGIFIIQPFSAGQSLVLSGDLTAAQILLRSLSGSVPDLDAVAHTITAESVSLGTVSAADTAKLRLGSGRHTIGGTLGIGAGNTSEDHELHYETCYIDLRGGTIDGAGLICTNTNATVFAGTIDNVDLTGETALLHLYPEAAGTGNTNVTEISPLIGTILMMARAMQIGSR